MRCVDSKATIRGMRAVLMALITLASTAVGPTAVGQEALLRIGVQNERPPFSYSDVEGVLQGFDVDIAWALSQP